MKPEFLLDTTNEPDPKTGKPKCLKCGFTLVITFSRRWCVKPFFERFMKMAIDMDHCHLLIFDNSDRVLLKNDLLPVVENLSKHFYTTRYYKSYRTVGGTFRWEPDQGIEKSKLPMIYAMHLDFVNMINTKRFVLLEDDTLVPVNTVPRLLSLLAKNKDAAIVTGIETGRDPNPRSLTRLGVHYVQRDNNVMLKRLSLDPNTKGLVEVDCCGWFCCASYVDAWKKGFEGFNNYFKDLPRFALDGMHTNNIKRAGHKILADFSMWCEHLQACGGKIISWGKEKAVPMIDVYIPEYKYYAQGIILKPEDLPKEISKIKSAS